MKVLLTLHVIAVIFLIGPLVAASMLGLRAARVGDAGALRASSRMVKIYGWGSLAAAILGASMVQGKDRGWGFAFSDAWLGASMGLFLVALGLTLGVLSPALQKASAQTEPSSSAKFVGRIAASGGTVSLLFVVITILMIYRPG